MNLAPLAALLLLAACGTSPEKEAAAVVKRTFGSVPENVRFREASGEMPSYSLEVSDGVLTIEGNSAVAMCKGFHDYILSEGLGISSWSGDRLDFPADLPDLPLKTVVSPFKDHLYYNVCTYGYTTPFWGWEQWEHELDWMALHGFDLPLAPIATEAILTRVWKSIGLSQEEIDAYFTGPAHFPWMRMGNMTEVDGGMSPAWHEEQIKLQHKILDRMNALGMKPVFQGFAGFVPKAVKDHYPDTKLMTTHWSGHESWMLDPKDSLFSVLLTSFIREWEKEFGKGEYYLIDSFNELDIPFGEQGSQERHDKLQDYSSTIYKALAAANPDAVWVMQGWMFGYQRDEWDPQSVEALLSGAPDDKLRIIDLAVDFNHFVWKNGNSWDNLSGFYGKPWIWSTVPNFGGRSALKGPLDFYLNGHLEALTSPSAGRLDGFGTSPEGIENNEIIYEMISAAGWSSAPLSVDSILTAYNKARYGASPASLDRFWEGMRASVYGNFTNNARFQWQQRPPYHRGETMGINDEYYRAIETFLAETALDDSELYVRDAIMYAALYLAGKADDELHLLNRAIVRGEAESARVHEELMLQILLDADRLLESHPILRLDRWMEFADAAATSAAEADAFRREIRRLLSVWSGPSLKDYSARVWSGLIRDWYVPRLRHYYDSVLSGVSPDMPEYDKFFTDTSLSAAEPFADPLAAARELVGRYSGISCDRGREIAYFCPQDFGGRSGKRLYLTMMASDFAGMKGLLVSDVRGGGRIVKAEFKSGPAWLGSTKDIKRVKGGFVIPFPGPGSTDGLEREVVVYLTIEGGPDTAGLVYFY